MAPDPAPDTGSPKLFLRCPHAAFLTGSPAPAETTPNGHWFPSAQRPGDEPRVLFASVSIALLGLCGFILPRRPFRIASPLPLNKILDVLQVQEFLQDAVGIFRQAQIRKRLPD